MWKHAGCLGCTTEDLDKRYGTRRRTDSRRGQAGRRSSFLSTTGSFTLSFGGQKACCDHLLMKVDANQEVWLGLKHAKADANVTSEDKKAKLGKEGDCIGKCATIVPILKTWFPNTSEKIVEQSVACTKAVANAIRL